MISKAIEKAVDIINRNLSDLKSEAVIIRNTETYDLATGKNVFTATEEVVSGFMDSFGFTEVDDVKVLQEDIKFMILSNTEIEFDSVKDQIKLGLLTYNIIGIKKSSISSKNILYILQLRM